MSSSRIKDDSARKRLAQIARTLAMEHRDKLEAGKQRAQDAEQPDWLWEALLLSFSTMGNARGAAGLMRNKENHDRVRFEALAQHDANTRSRVLCETLHAAKVRMPDKKAAWLAEAFDRIAEMGGIVAAKEKLFAQRGREAKMQFLRSFKGIGPKYSRNLLMDVYDPDFHESIALDSRILSISEMLRLKFRNYKEREQFYLTVAHDAGLQGWELDRLLFAYKQEFLDSLRSPFATAKAASA